MIPNLGKTFSFWISQNEMHVSEIIENRLEDVTISSVQMRYISADSRASLSKTIFTPPPPPGLSFRESSLNNRVAGSRN